MIVILLLMVEMPGILSLGSAQSG